MKKVLIFTVDAGYGHRSAANAIKEALEIRYPSECEVVINNPLEDERTPTFLKETQYDYDKIVSNMPELYRVIFSISDAKVTTALTESVVTVLIFEGIRDIIRSVQPDVIISTYPLYQVPTHIVKTIYGMNIPYYTVITDMASIHQFWFSDLVQGCMVANDIVKDKAIQNGVSEEKLHVTGIPVHPAITMEERSKEQVRKDLGLDPDLPTFLFVGSKRVEKMQETIQIFNHYGQKLQMIIVCGKNEELYNKLSENEWHQPHLLFDFVNNIPELMHASDAIICKAGGLITTESLASGLPLMITEFIPGQETGNAKLVEENEAGFWIQDPMDVLYALHHWMMDDMALLKKHAQNACNLGKGDAAITIADFIMDAPPATKGERRLPHPKLLEWFDKNHINWET
jgi:1,2-diacylglycerol 3-beta-galactosyltransferase